MATVWDAIAARNPLAMYRHSEASGLVMVDSSGNGRDGTIDASVVLGQASIMAGAPGTSWLLGSTVKGGRVTGASWMAPASAFTTLGFFKASSLAGGQMTLMARGDINGANLNGTKAWAVSILANGTVTGRVFTNLGSSINLASAAGAVTTGSLTMLTLIHDGTTAKICKNGSTVIASAALAGTPVSFATNSQPLTYGKDAGTVTPFNGNIQGGAFAGTAWTDADLDAIWTAANTTPISQGTGAGTWTFAGTATGKRTPKATGAGTWTFVGAAVGSAPSVASDPNPITLTIRDTGHRATVRETGHTTTVRSPSARATIREQH